MQGATSEIALLKLVPSDCIDLLVHRSCSSHDSGASNSGRSTTSDPRARSVITKTVYNQTTVHYCKQLLLCKNYTYINYWLVISNSYLSVFVSSNGYLQIKVTD